jgi:type IV secretory pathway TrbF-like protein
MTSRSTTPEVTPAGLPPHGYEYGPARRKYVEEYGWSVAMNAYLRIAVVSLSLVVVGLIVLTLRLQHAAENLKPLVIRIDEVGRATAVSYPNFTYTPQAPELKYFLVQFVTAHYGRLRATVRQQYAESLYFLDGRLADAVMEANTKSGAIERFLVSGDPDIDVHVKTVTLDDLRQSPYRATVEFEQVSLSPTTRTELKREAHVAHLIFVLKDHVDNARIPINPLGLTITYFREDQAFQ